MNRKRLFLVVVLVALFAGLLVLIGGISSFQPMPGKRLPNPFAALRNQASEFKPDESVFGADAIVRLIQALFVLGAAVILFSLVVSRRFRRQLAVILVLLLLGALVISQVKITDRGDSSLAASSGGPSSSVSSNEPQPEIPPASASNWFVILIAAVSSIIVAGLALLFYVNIYPAMRKHRATEELILDELGKQAGQAIRRILDGDDPRAAILRCYKEMSTILSRAERLPNFSYFTPREFASHLRLRGMKDEHVDRLTAIFETVRYGGRSGSGFADEAIACLQSIQLTYATDEESP